MKLWLEAAFYASYIWRLIPIKVEGELTLLRPQSGDTPSLSSLPSYDGDGSGQSSTQRAESEHDDFGTIVTEVTTSTTVVTTRKRYRVEDA